MGIIENIWWLLVLIGVMILIHELGHYWAARFFDVKVETFSFGFGPRLFGFRKGETDFRFSLIMFGGYVKMVGEQTDEATVTDPRSLLAKPRWQRLIIVFAGPAMNIVLAIGLMTGLYMVHFPKVPQNPSPIIGFVSPEGVAAKAGIKEGDRILSVEDVQNPVWEDIAIREYGGANKMVPFLVEHSDKRQEIVQMTPAFDDKIGGGVIGWSEELPVQIARLVPGMEAEKAGMKIGDLLISANGERIRSTLKLHEVMRRGEGRPVEIVYTRGGNQQTVNVTPQLQDLEGQKRWLIGVQLEPPVVFVALGVTDAFRESLRFNKLNAGLIFSTLRGIVERRLSAKQIEGPIRLAKISGDAAKEGSSTYLNLMAAVSLNLAIFNLLPIPILDGGQILLLLVEMLMRRDLSVAVKETVFKVGFLFIMMLVVFVLYNDITKLLPS